MAKNEHLKILQQGVGAWNKWREENPNVQPSLSDADLGTANLFRADLRRADLTNVRELTIEQLRTVKTLYGVRGLDSELMKQVKAQMGHRATSTAAG